MPRGAEGGSVRLFLLCFLCRGGGTINQQRAGKIIINNNLTEGDEKYSLFSTGLKRKGFLIELIDIIEKEQILKCNALTINA